MKKIFKIGLVIMMVLVFTGSIYAEEDATPPTGTILINNGALYTNTRDVTLTLSATDDLSEITEMNIANHTSYHGWEPYSTTKLWSLSDSGDGLKTVRVKFKNALGSETTTGIPATITLDTTTPVTLSSITITTPATKLNYVVGDVLDIGGLVVTGTYSDNSTQIETITADNISGFDSSVPATDQILTITHGAQTATYSVDIVTGDTDDSLSITADITLQDNCTVTDTNGVAHTFPEASSTSPYLAICALEEALEQNIVDDIDFADFGFGLFVNSVNNISEENTYWQLQLNNVSASVGASQLTLELGNTVSLVLTAFDPVTYAETPLEKSVTLTITALATEPAPSGGGGGGGTTPATFSTTNALNYLKSVQGTDGSFGNSSLYTDWAGIAFGAGDVSGSAKTNLLSYFNSHNTLSSLLTDNERRAIALLSLGQDPYSFNSVNYIKAIVDSFDGTQFGDSGEDNDDIFALIPLASAGYTKNDDIISKDIDFIISAQNSNGSWDGSIDMTAAAIQALKSFNSGSEAISKAEDYIKNAQSSDGGWGNISSTSWAIQAESALNASWSKNGKTGLDYLGTQQVTDGAVSPVTDTLVNRIWITSYAIPAGLGKPWSEIMQSVSKPETGNSGGSNNSGAETPAIPTPTAPVTCPMGDSFSAVTGQACTEFTPVNPLTPSTTLVNLNNNVPANNSKTQKSNTTLKNEKNPEITSDTLTASAINSLPDKTSSPIQTVPIVFGTVSGLAILYIAVKFLGFV